MENTRLHRPAGRLRAPDAEPERPGLKDCNEEIRNVSDTSLKTVMIRLAAAAMTVSILAACAAQAPQAQSEATAEKTYSFEPWDGDGMDIPLARVEAHTSAENYTTLKNAIEYLLVYDLSAKRDRAQLASNLDGLTPREVIAKVKWGRGQMGDSGPGPARPNDTMDL
jgi:hypothetical protein